MIVGLAVEFWQGVTRMSGGCGGSEGMWANVVGALLLGGYAVLFAGDLRERRKKQKNA